MLKNILNSGEKYNLHTHTQFCDGRDDIATMCAAACGQGFKYIGFTPHSPVKVESSCNMSFAKVGEYFDEISRMKELYDGRMTVLQSLEIDYLGPDFGPHIEYFTQLPLDYRLGSVHFVPTRYGELIDCDGGFAGFSKNLNKYFDNDVRYVVERSFESVLDMIDRGGIDMVGHFDKIINNSSQADPTIEDQGWYESLIDEVISNAVSKDIVIEINTKAYEKNGRYFPAERWWEKLLQSGATIAVDSDAHFRDKIENGRDEAIAKLRVKEQEYLHKQK